MAELELSSKERQALRFIRNSLVHKGKSPSVRELQAELGYNSPRSAALILESLIRRKCIERRSDWQIRLMRDLVEEKSHARTVLIPLVGTAPCGTPLVAEENIEAMIPISISLAKPGHRYFLLRARGNSMDQASINDGDLVLVRHQPTADNGKIVVALIDDEATIKEIYRTSTAVLLKPRSSSTEHRAIIVNRDFRIQGIVITTITKFD